MGDKPLTWQQVVAVLVIIVVGGFAVVAFGGNIEPKTRPIGYWGLAISLPVLLALLWWHWRSSHRLDLYPDILARMARPQDVLETRGIHGLIMPVFLPAQSKLVVLAQNTRDGEGYLQLRLSTKRDAPYIAPVDIELPPAGVMAAVADLPLTGLAGRELTWDVTARSGARGRRIRFRRYTALTAKINPILQLLALLGGHLMWGGGTTYRMRVPPTLTPNEPTMGWTKPWRCGAIWTLEDQAGIDEVKQAIETLIQEHDAAVVEEYPT